MIITEQRAAQLADPRNWRALDMGIHAGEAVASRKAAGHTIGKRLVSHKPQGHGPLDNGHRFDLPGGTRIKLQDVPTLAALEQKPGELAHLAEHGAQLGTIILDRSGVPSWTYEMTFPHGTVLVFQPELSAADIADGCIRPLAVVGSYALYANGEKFAHLMRPMARSKHGDIVWGTVTPTFLRREPEGDVWRVVVAFKPSEINRLAFPVTIDGNATMGLTGVGGSGAALLDDYVYAFQGNYAGVDGTLTGMSAHTTGATRSMALAIYYGVAETLVAQTASFASVAGNWSTANLSSSYDASGDTGLSYAAALNHDGATNLTLAYDASSDLLTEGILSDAYSAPYTFLSPANFGYQWRSPLVSIYITYTPAAGGSGGRVAAVNRGVL